MVNSGNVLELYQQKGQDRGRWLFAPEECNQLSVLICMNGLRKQTPGHVGPPFIAVKLFSLPVWRPLAKSRDY